MKVCGIIAEYNPIHSGHLFHITQSRKVSDADFIIAVISGSYVQRGEPAFYDKYTRTRSALRAGADVVIEMPAAVSLGSSEYFAKGAIDILNSTNTVSSLSFGSECNDIMSLSKAASILSDEPEDLSSLIKSRLSSGMNYSAALCSSVTEIFPELSGILGNPNNNLGIDYLKALNKTGSSIVPFTVQRTGLGYHETSPTDSHPSATMLRELIMSNEYDKALSYLPQELLLSFNADADNTQSFRHFLSADDFSEILAFRLIYSDREILQHIPDTNDDFINRLIRCKNDFTDFLSFAACLKRKNITLSRINRILFRLILGINDEINDFISFSETAPYIRILGMKQSAGPLVKEIKKNAVVPVICKAYSDSKSLSGMAEKLFNIDENAYRLYRRIYTSKYKNLTLPESGVVIF